MHRRTIGFTAASALLVLSLTGCGATVNESAKPEQTRVDVQRCGQTVSYTRPERVIAYEAGSADKMFALDLDDKLLGYVMAPTNPDPATSPYADRYAATRLLSSDLLNKEVVVQNRADLVIAGWNSGFSEKRGITPAILDELGIQSFMHTESCFNYPGFPEKKTPFEALYTDFERLGKIFGVEDRAANVVAGLKSRVEKVRASVPKDAPRPSVFLYDSGTDQASTVGNQVPADEIISTAGGKNIFGNLEQRYTQVSWESVAAANPEMIVIMSYRDQPASQKIEFLKSNPAMQEVPAVKNNRFFVMDYNELISGPRVIDGTEKLAAWLAENR